MGSMTMIGPMTLIITVSVAVMFIVGAALIRKARREQSAARQAVDCPQCGTANANHAKFCAHCGAPMST